MPGNNHGGFREGSGLKRSDKPRCPCDEMTLRRCLTRRGKCAWKKALLRSLAEICRPANPAPESVPGQ